MEITRMQVGALGTNCYLAWCRESKAALVIDPGADAETILATIKDLGLQVQYIVNTHGHLDHIGANSELHSALNCPIAIGREDQGMLTSAQENLSHHMGRPITSPAAQILLEDGDELDFGCCRLRVLATPGHTRGGISLYGHGVLFAGDTLFQRSIGRWDLPGGNQQELLTSIKTRLLTLPDTTRVLPGHGPETSIGEERVHNPWLQG